MLMEWVIDLRKVRFDNLYFRMDLRELVDNGWPAALY